jgi:hypothetical protein
VWPTDIAVERRNVYPIHVAVEERTVLNQLAGEVEKRQVVIVEDHGTGMTRDVVERFLLQVGRSYYASPEFRSQFPFNPTSQFGIGFLSTFAVSDEIHVDTFRPQPSHPDQPLRLTLTGPRNYLLTERSDRTQQGTRVEVVMRKPIPVDELTSALRGWCRRLEFPVIIDALGQRDTIFAEEPRSFLSQEPSALASSKMFSIRLFPIRSSIVLGEFYVFVYTTSAGEQWNRHSWAKYTYRNLHPNARVPELPESLVCQHGISIGGRHTFVDRSYRDAYSTRVDVRGANVHTDLSRSSYGASTAAMLERELMPQLSKILQEHLSASPFARGPRAWMYRQQLMGAFANKEFWVDVPGTVPMMIDGTTSTISVHEGATLREFATVFRSNMRESSEYQVPSDVELAATEDVASRQKHACLLEDCLVGLSEIASKEIFNKCHPVAAALYDRKILAIRWCRDAIVSPIGYLSYGTSRPLYALPCQGTDALGIQIHETVEAVYGPVIANVNHPFVKWLLQVKEAAASGVAGFTKDQFDRLLALLATPLCHRGFKIQEVEIFIRPWRDASSVPEHLRPPHVAAQDFAL